MFRKLGRLKKKNKNKNAQVKTVGGIPTAFGPVLTNISRCHAFFNVADHQEK